jgi:hypothetical protein
MVYKLRKKGDRHVIRQTNGRRLRLWREIDKNDKKSGNKS